MQLQTNARILIRKPQRTSSVFINEERYHVKNITTSSDKTQAHSLRHKVFSQELGWVPTASNSMEMDAYDEGSVFFGVFDGSNHLRAFLRAVMPQRTFMLEKEFPFLLKEGYQVRKHYDTVEISRLCVAPEARNEKFTGNFGVHSVSIMLYKGLYHWCLKNSIRYLYLVVEEKVFRLLCARGFPCKLVGDPKVMPDGVVAVAAILDWRHFEEICRAKRPNMFAWFSQYRSNPLLTQLPLREADSQHPAFS